MTRRILLAACVLFALSGPIFGQDKFHIIPQIADGVFSDGSYYKSTLMVLPWFESTAATCNLRLYGLSVTLNGVRSNNLTFTLPVGGYYSQQTAADQVLAQGYATLTCSDYVFAQILYSFYAANGTKLSEATVFSTEGDFNYRMRLILDQRDRARLAFAIANNTDLPQSYRITLGSSSATMQVPARTSAGKFVDQLLLLPANATGILKIESTNFSSFGAVGLRFTGAAFTTIPAN